MDFSRVISSLIQLIPTFDRWKLLFFPKELLRRSGDGRLRAQGISPSREKDYGNHTLHLSRVHRVLDTKCLVSCLSLTTSKEMATQV